VTIDDVTFIGGTLWTDMNKEDSLTLYNIKGIMNDFRCVTNSNRIHTKTRPPSFTPEDSVEDHRKMLEYIRLTTSLMDKSNKYVVVGHHAPSKQSTHPR
jgi:hypothetical protein